MLFTWHVIREQILRADAYTQMMPMDGVGVLINLIVNVCANQIATLYI